jgi:hypothetical protein
MGLASFGLDIGIFGGFLSSVLLLNAILGLDVLGRALPPAAGKGFVYRIDGSALMTLFTSFIGAPARLPRSRPADSRGRGCH